jgi:hypothetical protein
VPRPPSWHRTLEASKQEAVLAVKLFNDPTGERNLEGFVVHMHLAWLYLLQADWTKAAREYRIRDSSVKSVRYKKIDGEYQTPSLEWFVQETWDQASAVRANLQFFIKLRNKIEHRHKGSDASLATLVMGQCNALLLNYEEALVSSFGNASSLALTLRFPIFVGGFTDEGKDALVKMTNQLPRDLRTFLADYDKSLDDAVSRDSRYCLRLTVVLEQGQRKGDLAMQFVKLDDLDDEARKALQDVAAKGLVVTRNKKVGVSNLGNLRATEAKDQVAKAIPYKFTMFHFTEAYKAGGYRPANNAKNPEDTRTDFVIYDDVYNDYTYTPAYVKYLIRKCSTLEGFRSVTGRVPVKKDAAPAAG